MRSLLFISVLICVVCCCHAAEPSPSAPLWDGHETVADYAQKVNLPPTRSIDLGGGVKLELVLIPAGRFIMGSAEPAKPTVTVAGAQTLLLAGGACVVLFLLLLIFKRRKGRRYSFSLAWLSLFTASAGLAVGGAARWHLALTETARYEAEKALYDQVRDLEMRAHPVTLTQPFYMGKYALTQAQYEALVGTNPSHFKGAQLPVETVSWNEATAFCKKLNERLRTQGLEARLPTEAQREYACRAGTMTAYSSGNLESDLDAVAWYAANSKHTTHPVGTKKPNAFGLYDMHGNVWELCADAYTGDDKALSAVDLFNEPGAPRVLRGGSWRDVARYCRSSYSVYFSRVGREDGVGFRVVCAPSLRTPP